MGERIDFFYFSCRWLFYQILFYEAILFLKLLNKKAFVSWQSVVSKPWPFGSGLWKIVRKEKRCFIFLFKWSALKEITDENWNDRWAVIFKIAAHRPFSKNKIFFTNIYFIKIISKFKDVKFQPKTLESFLCAKLGGS